MRDALRLAAVDMGSNSFHLVAVDAHADGSFDTLLREKEMLRLGDVVTRTGSIPADDVDRILETMRRFASLAASIGAVEIVACATSAMREASNSAEIVDLVKQETGIDVEVISGRREAELIFTAIQRSLALEPAPAVCLDLGGGSLEVMVGDNAELQWSTSLHLGAARLFAQFVKNDPPNSAELLELEERIVAGLGPVAVEVSRLRPQLMVGTSGTFLDLARMAELARSKTTPQSVNQLVTTRDELEELHHQLIGATADERARLPGVDSRRVDLIPVGSLLLLTAMELFGFKEMMVGEWALREGMVLDAIARHDAAEWSGDAEAIRGSSVRGLARRCNADERHARQVAKLAVSLFDQTREVHGLADSDRALLEYSAWLHDIGEHVAVESHHKHTAYLIEHGKLRGFDPDDVGVLSTLGRFHRRQDPKGSFEPFGRLSPDRRKEALLLLALLRLADGLDRGHSGAVDGVRVELTDARARLIVASNGNDDLEIWGVRRKRALFERCFDRRLEIVAAEHPSLGRSGGWEAANPPTLL